jgi:hypothetical protein
MPSKPFPELPAVLMSLNSDFAPLLEVMVALPAVLVSKNAVSTRLLLVVASLAVLVLKNPVNPPLLMMTSPAVLVFSKFVLPDALLVIVVIPAVFALNMLNVPWLTTAPTIEAVSSLQTAKAILVDCVTNFPLLAKLGGNALVESILGSPTLESVLSLFGVSYPSLSGRVAQLIGTDPSSAIDGAAWLAVTEHAKQFQRIAGLLNGPLSRSLWGRQSLAHAGLLITRFPTLLSD